MGDWFYEVNRAVLAARPARRFLPVPKYDVGRLRKTVSGFDSKLDSRILPLREDILEGGSVYFYAEARIHGPKGKVLPWLGVEFGYGLAIERGEDRENQAKPWLYANA